MPAPPALSHRDFEELGSSIMRRRGKKQREGSGKCWKRRFIALFGMEPVHVAILWTMLVGSGWLEYSGSRGSNPEHLLWALLFLKCYSTEELHAAQVGVCEKTFREWTWFYLTGIAKLDKKIVRADRYRHEFET